MTARPQWGSIVREQVRRLLCLLRDTVFDRLPQPIADRMRGIVGSALGRRFSKAAFWSLAGALCSRVMTQACYILTAHLLGQRGFGSLAMIESTLALFAGVATIGLGNAASREVAACRQLEPDRARRAIAFTRIVSVASGLVFGVVLLITAPTVALRSLAASELTPTLRLGTIYVVANAILLVQNATLVGLEGFKAIALLNVVTGISSFPIYLLLAWRFGLNGAVVAMTINQIISLALAGYFVHRESLAQGLTTSLAGWRRDWRRLLGFSVPSALAGIVTLAATWLANTMILGQPNGYEQLAIYNAANRWYALILFIPANLLAPMTPILTQELANGSGRRVLRLLKTSLVAAVPLMGAAAAVVAAVSPFIMRLYGAEFRSGWPVLCVLLAVAVVYGANMLIFSCLFATGRFWSVLLLNLAWAAVYLGVTHLLRQKGAMAIAMAQMAAFVVMDLAALAVLTKILGKAEPAPGA